MTKLEENLLVNPNQQPQQSKPAGDINKCLTCDFKLPKLKYLTISDSKVGSLRGL